MAATKFDLISWFQLGEGHKRMVVWCDEFDWEDYPEYTDLTGDDLRDYVGRRDGTNMRRLMEVYDLTMDMDEQMNVRRAFNY